MAWKLPCIFAPLLLASCSDQNDARYAVPGTLVMDRIERQLAGRPCIGALDRWERHYEYAFDFSDPALTRVDRNIVNFAYSEAGVDPYRSRRVLEGVGIDERYMRFMWGEYHVRSGALFVHSCGHNSEPPSPATAESWRRARNTP